MPAISRASVPGSQHSRECLRQIAVLKRLAQHFINADRSRSLRELRATIDAHQDDSASGPEPPDFAREFGADEIGHRLIGENKIEALRLASKRLQRRATRIETHRLVAEFGEQFLSERNEQTLVVDNHYRLGVSAPQLR